MTYAEIYTQMLAAAISGRACRDNFSTPLEIFGDAEELAELATVSVATHVDTNAHRRDGLRYCGFPECTGHAINEPV